MAPEDIGDDSNSNEDKSGAIEFPGETDENIENDNPSEGTEDSNNENTENSEVSATESEVSATESEVSSTNISTSKSEVSSSRTEVSSSKTEISSSKSEVSSSKKPVSSSKEEPISSSKEEPISSSKEEPATPSGKQVVQGGTADTSFGVKIPVVSEFNTLALDSRNYWTGETSASNDFSKAFGEALQKYSDAANYGIHDSPIQDAGDYVFHTGVAGDDMGPITLWRDPEKGCYYFYYTVDLRDYDEEGIAINRDLSRFLLALVTSTPTEVEKAIYETQYTAPNGKEPIPLDGSWAKIGDCEIKATRWQPDPYIAEYAIRPCK